MNKSNKYGSLKNVMHCLGDVSLVPLDSNQTSKRINIVNLSHLLLKNILHVVGQREVRGSHDHKAVQVLRVDSATTVLVDLAPGNKQLVTENR